MQLMPRLTPVSSGAALILVAAAFFSAELWIGARVSSVAIFLFALLVAFVQTLAGLLALRAGRLEDIKARLPAAFCVGFACLSLPMYALSSLLDVSALTAFAVCAAGVGGLGLALGTRRPAAAHADGADVAIALLFAAAIVVLTRVPVASARALEVGGTLPIWSDFFLHGVTISSFGGPFAIGTEMELQGVGRVFYHYAPFLLPAAFGPVSGLTGLELATSMLLPLGLMVAAMGCYAFAVQIGGRTAGLLAVTALAAVPAFRVPLQSGWLDFYWMLLASPGGGYAIGVSMVVCAATLVYADRGGTRLFWFIGLLLLSTILIRVQFFMLLAPAIAMYLGLRHRWLRRRAVLLGLCAVVITTLVCVLVTPSLRDWYVATSQPVSYLDTALRFTQWRGKALALPGHPVALTVVAKILLVLVAVLGAYALVYPALALAVRRRFGLGRSDLLVPFITLSFVGLMLLAPIAGNGDITEFKHRHFPMLYIIVALYSVVYAWRLIAAHAGESPSLHRGAGLLALVVLAAAALASRGSNPSKPNVEAMPWAAEFHNQSVAPGLLATAGYIRAHAGAGDILAMAGDAPNGQSQMIVDLISTTGIPAFLARSELRMRREPCVRKTVEMRAKALKRIALAADWPEARRLMQDNAIRWFVEAAGDSPRWDPARQAAVFSSDGMSVYDAGVPATDARPPTQDCR
jgi:hypothetical protein